MIDKPLVNQAGGFISLRQATGVSEVWLQSTNLNARGWLGLSGRKQAIWAEGVNCEGGRLSYLSGEDSWVKSHRNNDLAGLTSGKKEASRVWLLCNCLVIFRGYSDGC